MTQRLRLILGSLTFLILLSLSSTAYTAIITRGGTNLDTGGNVVIISPLHFVPRIADTTPPYITSITETIGNDTANITWTTNEAGDYTFNIDIPATYINSTFSLTHYINLTGLSNSTLYTYNITICDDAGNCNTTANRQFITNSNPGLVLPTICTDSPTSLSECTFIAGSFNCSNYTIYNLTGTAMENGSLLSIGVPGGGSVKYFKLNLSEGDYFVDFCDGTTKAISVAAAAEEDDEMAFAGIALLIVGGMFFLIYVASKLSLESENQAIVKINMLLRYIFTIFAIVMLFFSLQLAYGISLEKSYTGSVTSSLSTIYYLLMVLLPVVLILVTWGTFINKAMDIWAWVLKGLGLDKERQRRD